METLTVRPKNKKQLMAVTAILKALDVDFNKEKDSPYDPEFVAMIHQGTEDIKNGKGTKIKPEGLWK
jgi:meiotically up-regulated gene 157 (Mug157) protein